MIWRRVFYRDLGPFSYFSFDFQLPHCTICICWSDVITFIWFSLDTQTQADDSAQQSGLSRKAIMTIGIKINTNTNTDTNMNTVFDRISAPGAYFKFRLQGGHLIEEGRLFEGRHLLTKLQGLRVRFYDVAFIKKTETKTKNKRKMFKIVHSTSTLSSPSSSFLSKTFTSSLASSWSAHLVVF